MPAAAGDEPSAAPSAAAETLHATGSATPNDDSSDSLPPPSVRLVAAAPVTVDTSPLTAATKVVDDGPSTSKLAAAAVSTDVEIDTNVDFSARIPSSQVGMSPAEAEKDAGMLSAALIPSSYGGVAPGGAVASSNNYVTANTEGGLPAAGPPAGERCARGEEPAVTPVAATTGPPLFLPEEEGKEVEAAASMSVTTADTRAQSGGTEINSPAATASKTAVATASTIAAATASTAAAATASTTAAAAKAPTTAAATTETETATTAATEAAATAATEAATTATVAAGKPPTAATTSAATTTATTTATTAAAAEVKAPTTPAATAATAAATTATGATTATAATTTTAATTAAKTAATSAGTGSATAAVTPAAMPPATAPATGGAVGRPAASVGGMVENAGGRRFPSEGLRRDERADVGERVRGVGGQEAAAIGGVPPATATEDRGVRQRGGVGGGGGVINAAFPRIEEAAANVMAVAPRLPAAAGIICLVNAFFCLTLLCLYMLLEDFGDSSREWRDLTAGGAVAHSAAEALLNGAVSVFESDSPPRLLPTVIFISNPLSSSDAPPSLYYRPPLQPANQAAPMEERGPLFAASDAGTTSTRNPRSTPFEQQENNVDASVSSSVTQPLRTAHRTYQPAAVATVTVDKHSHPHQPPLLSTRRSESSSSRSTNSSSSESSSFSKTRGHEIDEGEEEKEAGSDRVTSSVVTADEAEEHTALDSTEAQRQSRYQVSGNDVGHAVQGTQGIRSRNVGAKRGSNTVESQQHSFESKQVSSEATSRSSTGKGRQGKRRQSTTAAVDNEGKKTGGGGKTSIQEQGEKSNESTSWWPSFSLKWLVQRAEELPLSHAILRRVDSLRLLALRLHQHQRREEAAGGSEEDTISTEGLPGTSVASQGQEQQQQQVAETFASHATPLHYVRKYQRLLKEEDTARFVDATVSHVIISALLSRYSKENISDSIDSLPHPNYRNNGLSHHLSRSNSSGYERRKSLLLENVESEVPVNRATGSSNSDEINSSSSSRLRREPPSPDRTPDEEAQWHQQKQPEESRKNLREGSVGTKLLQQLSRYLYVANPLAFAPPCARRGPHHSVQLLRCPTCSTSRRSGTASPLSAAENGSDSFMRCSVPQSAIESSGIDANGDASVPVLLRHFIERRKEKRASLIEARTDGGEDDTRGEDRQQLESSGNSSRILFETLHSRQCVDVPSVLEGISLVRRLLLRSGPFGAALPADVRTNWDHVLQLLPLYDLQEMPVTPPPHTLHQRLTLPFPRLFSNTPLMHEEMHEEGGQPRQIENKEKEEEEEEEQQDTEDGLKANKPRPVLSGEDVVVETALDAQANYLYVFVLYRRDPVYASHHSTTTSEREPSVLWVQHSFTTPTTTVASSAEAPSDILRARLVHPDRNNNNSNMTPLRKKASEMRDTSYVRASTGTGENDEQEEQEEEPQRKATSGGGAGRTEGPASLPPTGEILRYRTRLVIYRRSLVDLVQAALVAKPSRASLLQLLENVMSQPPKSDFTRRQQERTKSSSFWDQLYRGGNASTSSFFTGVPGWLFESLGRGRGKHRHYYEPVSAAARSGMRTSTHTATDMNGAASIGAFLEAMRIGGEPPLHTLEGRSLAAVLQELLQQHQQRNQQQDQSSQQQQQPQIQQEEKEEHETKQKQQETQSHPKSEGSTILHAYGQQQSEISDAEMARNWASRWWRTGHRLLGGSYAYRQHIDHFIAPGSFFVFTPPYPRSAAALLSSRRAMVGTRAQHTGDFTPSVHHPRQQQQHYDTRTTLAGQQTPGPTHTLGDRKDIKQGQEEMRDPSWKEGNYIGERSTYKRGHMPKTVSQKTVEAGAAAEAAAAAKERQTRGRGNSGRSSSLYYIDTSPSGSPTPYGIRLLSHSNGEQPHGTPSLWEARAAVRVSALNALDGMDRMVVAAALAAGYESTDHFLYSPQDSTQREMGGEKEQQTNETWFSSATTTSASQMQKPVAQLPTQPLAVPFEFARDAVELTLLTHTCHIHTSQFNNMKPVAVGAFATPAGGSVAATAFSGVVASNGHRTTDGPVETDTQQQQRCTRGGGRNDSRMKACDANIGSVDFQQRTYHEQGQREACTNRLESYVRDCSDPGSSAPVPTASAAGLPSALPTESSANTHAAHAAEERTRTDYTSTTGNDDARTAAPLQARKGITELAEDNDVEGAASWLRPQLYLPDSLYLVLGYRREARDAYNALMERRGSLVTAAVRLPIAVASAGGQLLLSYAEFLYLLFGEISRCSSSLSFILKVCMRNPKECYARMQQDIRPMPKHPWLDLLPVYRHLHWYYTKERQQQQQQPQQHHHRHHHHEQQEYGVQHQQRLIPTSQVTQEDPTQHFRESNQQPPPVYEEPTRRSIGLKDKTVEAAETPLTPGTLLQLAVTLSAEIAVVLWEQQRLFVKKTFGILLGTENDLEEQLVQAPSFELGLDDISSNYTNRNGGDSSRLADRQGHKGESLSNQQAEEEAAFYEGSSHSYYNSGDSQQAVASEKLRSLKLNYSRVLVMSQRTFEQAAAAAAAAAAGHALAAMRKRKKDQREGSTSRSSILGKDTLTSRSFGHSERDHFHDVASLLGGRNDFAVRRAVENSVWESQLNIFEHERQRREEQELRSGEIGMLPWTHVRSAADYTDESAAANATSREEEEYEESEEEESIEQQEEEDRWVAQHPVGKETPADSTSAPPPAAVAAAAEKRVSTGTAAEPAAGTAVKNRGRQQPAGGRVLGAQGEDGIAAQQLQNKQQGMHVRDNRRTTISRAPKSSGGQGRAAVARGGARGAPAAPPQFENAWEELLALVHGGLQQLSKSRLAAPAVYLSRKLHTLLSGEQVSDEGEDSSSVKSEAARQPREEQLHSEDKHSATDISMRTKGDEEQASSLTVGTVPLGATEEVSAAVQKVQQLLAQQQEYTEQVEGLAATQDAQQQLKFQQQEQLALQHQKQHAEQREDVNERDIMHGVADTAALDTETETAAGFTESGDTEAAGVSAVLWALTEGISTAALGSAMRGFQLLRSYAIEGDQAWLTVDQATMSAAVVYSQRKNLDTQWRVTIFPRIDRTADRLLSRRRQYLYEGIMEQQLRESEQHKQRRQFAKHTQHETGEWEPKNEHPGVRTPPSPSGVQTQFSGGVTHRHGAEMHKKTSGRGVPTPVSPQGIDGWHIFSGVHTPQLVEGMETLKLLSGGETVQELTTPLSIGLTLTVGAPPIDEDEEEVEVQEEETQGDGDTEKYDAEREEDTAATVATAWRKKQTQQMISHGTDSGPVAVASTPKSGGGHDILPSTEAQGGVGRRSNSIRSHSDTNYENVWMTHTASEGKGDAAGNGSDEEDQHKHEDVISTPFEYELLTLKFEGSAAVETGVLSSDGLIFKRTADDHLFRQSLPLAALLRYHHQQVQGLRSLQRRQEYMTQKKGRGSENGKQDFLSFSRKFRRMHWVANKAAALPVLPDYVGPRIDSGTKKRSGSSVQRQEQEQQLHGEVVMLQTIKGSFTEAAAAAASPVSTLSLDGDALLGDNQSMRPPTREELLLPPSSAVNLALLVKSMPNLINYSLVELQQVWVPFDSPLCPSRVRNSSKRLAAFVQQQEQHQRRQRRRSTQLPLRTEASQKKQSGSVNGTLSPTKMESNDKETDGKTSHEGREKEEREYNDSISEPQYEVDMCVGWILHTRAESKEQVRVFQPVTNTGVGHSNTQPEASGSEATTETSQGGSARSSSSWWGDTPAGNNQSVVGVFDFLREPLWVGNADQRSFAFGYLLKLQLYRHQSPQAAEFVTPLATLPSAGAGAAPPSANDTANESHTGFADYHVADIFPEYWRYAPAFRLLAVSDDGRYVAGVSGVLGLHLHVLPPRSSRPVVAGVAARAQSSRGVTREGEDPQPQGKATQQQEPLDDKPTSPRQKLQELLTGALFVGDFRFPLGRAAGARPYVREIDVTAALQQAGMDLREPRRIVSISFFPMSRYIPTLNYPLVANPRSLEKGTEPPVYLVLLLDDGHLVMLFIDPNGAVLPSSSHYNNFDYLSFSWHNIIILFYILLLVLFHLRGHQLLMAGVGGPQVGNAAVGGLLAAAAIGGGAAAAAAAQTTNFLLHVLRLSVICMHILTSAMLFPLVTLLLACLRALRIVSTGFRATADIRLRILREFPLQTPTNQPPIGRRPTAGAPAPPALRTATAPAPVTTDNHITTQQQAPTQTPLTGTWGSADTTGAERGGAVRSVLAPNNYGNNTTITSVRNAESENTTTISAGSSSSSNSSNSGRSTTSSSSGSGNGNSDSSATGSITSQGSGMRESEAVGQCRTGDTTVVVDADDGRLAGGAASLTPPAAKLVGGAAAQSTQTLNTVTSAGDECMLPFILKEAEEQTSRDISRRQTPGAKSLGDIKCGAGVKPSGDEGSTTMGAQGLACREQQPPNTTETSGSTSHALSAADRVVTAVVDAPTATSISKRAVDGVRASGPLGDSAAATGDRERSTNAEEVGTIATAATADFSELELRRALSLNAALRRREPRPAEGIP